MHVQRQTLSLGLHAMLEALCNSWQAVATALYGPLSVLRSRMICVAAHVPL